MRCGKCNREMDEAAEECPYCGGVSEERVRVLTPEERVRYDGVTIDTEERARGGERMRGPRGGPRVYVRHIGGGSSGWLTKLVIFAAVVAIAAFLLFVALPVALIGVGVGVVVWMVLSFLRG